MTVHDALIVSDVYYDLGEFTGVVCPSPPIFDVRYYNAASNLIIFDYLSVVVLGGLGNG